MTYDDIFLFVKLINIGTFSGLAKSLNITQGTISQRIKNLEKDLNLQLIRRNSRGLLEMTPDGEVLFTKFSNQEQYLKDALEDVLDRQNTVEGTLKVVMPHLVYNKIVLPHLHEFQKNNPKAKLIISYTGNSVDLLKDNFDLAISTHQPKSQNSKFKLLKKSNIKLYASKEYVASHNLPSTLSELSQHKMVGRSVDNIPIKQRLVTNLQTGDEEIIEYEANVSINNASYNIEMATVGNFIIDAADMLVSQNLTTGALVAVLPDYSFGTVNFYLIRSNEIHGKLEREFTEFIVDCFNQVSHT